VRINPLPAQGRTVPLVYHLVRPHVLGESQQDHLQDWHERQTTRSPFFTTASIVYIRSFRLSCYPSLLSLQRGITYTRNHYLNHHPSLLSLQRGIISTRNPPHYPSLLSLQRGIICPPPTIIVRVRRTILRREPLQQAHVPPLVRKHPEVTMRH
jgi:hypothetical protein